MHSKLFGTRHYKRFNISTFHTNTYKTLTNQQPTYLYNSLSFPSHSVSTRSSDSLVLSIPYVKSSLGKRSLAYDFGIHYLLIPEIRIQSSIPGLKHTSSKLHSLSRALSHLPELSIWILIFAILILCLIE